jgi:hypothetical protein
MKMPSSNQRPVSPERNGWRDEGISERHRRWGWQCPAVDLDFVLCEYDAGRPVAIVEYKCETAAPVKLSHPTMRALRTLSDRAKLPFFLTIYSREYVAWRVVGVNYLATQRLPRPRDFSESEYVDFMLAVRGRQPNGELF